MWGDGTYNAPHHDVEDDDGDVVFLAQSDGGFVHYVQVVNAHLPAKGVDERESVCVCVCVCVSIYV